MPYNLVEPCYGGSSFKHLNTDFRATWSILTCNVDSIFSPALLFTPSESNIEMAVHALDASSISAPEVISQSPANFSIVVQMIYSNFHLNTTQTHQKIRSAHYRDFQKDSHLSVDADALNNWGVLPQIPHGETPLPTPGGLLMSISTPQLMAKVPPGLDHLSESSREQSGGAKSGQKAGRLGKQGSSGRSPHGGTSSTRNSYSSETLPKLLASTSVAKLPLLPPPQKVPDNTLDVINSSIKKGSFKKPGSSSHLLNEYSTDLFEEGTVDIGEHAFSVASAGGANNTHKGSAKAGHDRHAGLSASVVKSISAGTLSNISVNNHGNYNK